MDNYFIPVAAIVPIVFDAGTRLLLLEGVRVVSMGHQTG